MSREDRILSILNSGRRLCDDCLSDITAIKPRQSIYQACTSLRDRRVITRMQESCESCHRFKITNAVIVANKTKSTNNTSQANSQISTPAEEHFAEASEKPWYWEGNIQDKIIKFLAQSNIAVTSTANTATREQGKDIEAMDEQGNIIWVTVKGFPEKSQNTQARHWFSGVLLDLALYKDQNQKAQLAAGLPFGFSTYENLVYRVASTLKFLGCHIYWVRENGIVTRESFN